MTRVRVRRGMMLGVPAVGLLLIGAWLVMAAPIGYQAVPQDAFPVFDNPRMLTADEAEARRQIFDRDMVIGVAHRGEAKVYPITLMGVHEVGNDTIGGAPIVTW